MPVIRYVPCDPTDVVIQGAQMPPVRPPTNGAVDALLSMDPVGTSTAEPPGDQIAGATPSMAFWPDPPVPGARLRAETYTPMQNAVVCTPCGATINVATGDHPIAVMRPMGSTTRWVIAGTTRNSSGAALAACRVVILEVGRIAVDGAPVIAETISDGAGLFSIAVPGNSDYQLLAYLPGSPDVAGITLHPLTPTQNG